jgi:hypothetical protein
MKNNRIIVIGGCARTGTTVLANLIGTLNNIEYFFEPPTMKLLFNYVNNIEHTIWKELFYNYLYNDLFYRALAGRNINLNKNDDSSIYNYKSEKDISFRLSRSFRQFEMKELSKDKVIAFKILEEISNFSHVKKIIPDILGIVIYRNANDTINSLLSKGWFSDKSLDPDSTEPASMFSVEKGIRICNFVKLDDIDYWIRSSEIERCAYYYIRAYKEILKIKNDLHFINYDNFIFKPEEELIKILSLFKLAPGSLTNQKIKAIKYQKKYRQNLLDYLPENVFKEIHEVEDKYNHIISLQY